MTDCLFCKIIGGAIKADIIAEDEELIAFRDISPQAPLHVLIVPRKHIATLNDVAAADAPLLGQAVLLAARIAKEQGVADDGYRLVWNCNRGAGQSVFHLHLHLLGGRRLGWPPG